MAEATLQWTAGGTETTLDVDITPTQGYERTAEVTEHPVERGEPVSDHVKVQNGIVTLEGFITNAPVSLPSGQLQGATRSAAAVDMPGAGRATLLRWSSPIDRVRECDVLLDDLLRSRELVTLTTSLRFLESLVLTRYKVDKSTGGGDAIAITLELKQVRIVGTQRVAVPAVRRLQVPPNRGPQPAAPNTSVARNIHRAIARAFGGG